MNQFNLLEHLRPSNVEVTILGRRWLLSGRTAADWIGGLGYDPLQLTGIVPGMIDEQQIDEMYLLSQQHDDIEQRWFQAALVALGRAAGRDWVWAYNLSLSALQGWQYVNGLLLQRHVNAQMLPLADWLDAAYMLLWDRCDESDRKAFDFQLLLPPKDLGVAASPQATRKMLEAFAAD